MNSENKDNPWKTLAVRQCYDNPWISVEHFDVLTPGGNPGIYGKVHYKNIAIGILPLDDELNTWLVGQYRFLSIPIPGRFLKAAGRSISHRSPLPSGNYLRKPE